MRYLRPLELKNDGTLTQEDRSEVKTAIEKFAAKGLTQHELLPLIMSKHKKTSTQRLLADRLFSSDNNTGCCTPEIAVQAVAHCCRSDLEESILGLSSTTAAALQARLEQLVAACARDATHGARAVAQLLPLMVGSSGGPPLMQCSKLACFCVKLGQQQKHEEDAHEDEEEKAVFQEGEQILLQLLGGTDDGNGLASCHHHHRRDPETGRIVPLLPRYQVLSVTRPSEGTAGSYGEVSRRKRRLCAGGRGPAGRGRHSAPGGGAADATRVNANLFVERVQEAKQNEGGPAVNEDNQVLRNWTGRSSAPSNPENAATEKTGSSRIPWKHLKVASTNRKTVSRNK